MRKKKRGRVIILIVSLLILGSGLLWIFRKQLQMFAPSEIKKTVPQENISDEDRKRLEEILKRR